MSEIICKTEKELAEAIKKEEDTIIVEGDLKKGVVRIKGTGKVAWGICAASLAVAITAVLATPVTATVPPAEAAKLALTAPAAIASTTILGTAVVSAVIIGVCAGGIGVLTTLRDKYKIVEKTNQYVKLKKK